MSKVIHKGSKPKYALTDLNNRSSMFQKRPYYRYYEEYPDGGGRYWTKRQLIPGCNTSSTKVVDSKTGLIYCEYCDEWFRETEFVDE